MCYVDLEEGSIYTSEGFVRGRSHQVYSENSWSTAIAHWSSIREQKEKARREAYNQAEKENNKYDMMAINYHGCYAIISPRSIVFLDHNGNQDNKIELDRSSHIVWIKQDISFLSDYNEFYKKQLLNE